MLLLYNSKELYFPKHFFMNINPNPEAPQYKSGFSNIKNYILYNLGYPVVRVELTEEQIITCIIDSLTLFTKYCGEIEYKLITVNTLGINYVEIPDDPDYQSFPTPDPDPFNPAPPVNQTAVKLRHTSIVDVVFTATTLDRLGKALMTGGLAGGFEDYSLPLNSYLSGGSSYVSDFDITSYYLYMQKLEDFKKTLGLKQMWEILNNKIYLYPADYAWDDPIGILYKPAVTEEYAEQEEWIKEYALAKAKVILGRIRSKLSGFNSGGMNIAADGESLISEGREDIATLKEQLMSMSPVMPFIQD